MHGGEFLQRSLIMEAQHRLFSSSKLLVRICALVFSQRPISCLFAFPMTFTA